MKQLSRRVARVLALVPYVIQNPGVTLSDLASHFNVSRRDLEDDLQMLWMCGLPGYTPLELMEVVIEEDRVWITSADYFQAPLKLTAAEGLALYLGLAAGVELERERNAGLRRALAKLGRAIGIEAGGEGERVVVGLEGPPGHMQELHRALEQRRMVRIEYLAAGRGDMTERDVDPWGLVAALGRWYLVGYDHLRDDERMFRTDRIKSVTVLDTPADVPDDFDPERYRGAFVGRPAQPKLRLEISPEVARWFEDYYPVASAEELRDGWRAIELISGGDRWAATLLLRLGDRVRNVEPEAAVGEARRLAAAIAGRHR